MEPFLISTNTTKIASDKSALTTTVALFQDVYNAIKATGVTPTLQEISDLVNWTVSNSGNANFEYDYILNKLLDAAAPYTLNGVQLQKSAVRDMIAPPDVSGLKTALNEARAIKIGIIGNDLALMVLANDVISKVANSDTVIETRNTHYTASDASTTRANELQVICDALNSFDAAHGKPFAKSITENIAYFETNFKGLVNPLKTILPGIEYRSQFVVSLAYIRGFEATNQA